MSGLAPLDQPLLPGNDVYNDAFLHHRLPPELL